MSVLISEQAFIATMKFLSTEQLEADIAKLEARIKEIEGR